MVGRGPALALEIIVGNLTMFCSLILTLFSQAAR